MVAKFTQPNFTTQSAAIYKAAIDAAIAVLARQAAAFAAHEQDIGSPAPELSVRVDAGFIWKGTTLTEVAAQTVGGFTTPSAGQHRIDRVVYDPTTGTASRVAGTAVTGSPSATAPAIPSGKLPVCQVLITASDASVTNSMITDERVPIPAPLAVNGSSLVLIERQSVSDVATVDFDTGIDDTYDEYVIKMSDVQPANDGVNLLMRLSEDGGSTYKAGASDYSHAAVIQSDATTTLNNSTGTTAILLANVLGNVERLMSEVRFGVPSGSTKKIFMVDTAWETNTNNTARWAGTGFYEGTTNPINAIRILASTGNISGKFALYGLRKA